MRQMDDPHGTNQPHKLQNRHNTETPHNATAPHELLDTAVRLLSPVVLLFGAHLVLRGADSPGGGFQAGAIFTAIFILRQLARPSVNMGYALLKVLEKGLFIAIILFGSLCVLQTLLPLDGGLGGGFLLLMNILIGTKVMCGLSIIFVRFVLMEGGISP